MTGEEFSGRVAMVTGAGSGIGAAVAERLARGGAKVLLGDINEPAVAAVARRISSQYDASVRPVHLDVTIEDSVANAVRIAMEELGGLHMAHNNAGIAGPNPVMLADHDLATFRQVMNINVEGVFLGMKYQIPAMVKCGGGAIVNTSSILGCIGAAGVVPYVTSKHAVIGMTRAAAMDYAEAGIRVNAVCPGSVRTPILDHYDEETIDAMTKAYPVKRLGKVEEIAETVAFLLSDRASFTTGASYPVDGGITIQ